MKFVSKYFLGLLAVTTMFVFATLALAEFVKDYRGTITVEGSDSAAIVLNKKGSTGHVDLYTGSTPTRTVRALATGDLALTTSGTLALQEATAGTKCMGTATATGATAVVVATTCATTGSRIFISRSSAPSGTAQCWATTIVDGTSFELDCSGAETGTFNWIIFHEAA